MDSTQQLLDEVRRCTRCAADLPFAPRPILQLDSRARLVIAGQAPGRRAHQRGVPFDDPSGDRLRDWLGLDREQFYAPRRVAILPVGMCYPGSGRSGDLPPRPECADAWRERLLSCLSQRRLTLIIGRYALDRYLPGGYHSVTAAVRDWRTSWPTLIPLPHPSPRNNRWLKRNPWFELELLPPLRERVADILRQHDE